MTINSGIFCGGDTSGRHTASGAEQGRDTGHWRALRIVVADDEKDTVSTLTAILEDEGHKVRPIHHASDVMAAIQSFEPDAVILDIAMPEISGYDLAKEIRTRFVAYRPLLIAISGVYVKGNDKFLSRAVGFDHHLAKPCNIDDLLDLLAPLARSPGRR